MVICIFCLGWYGKRLEQNNLLTFLRLASHYYIGFTLMSTKSKKINDFSWFKIYLHNQIYLLPCTTYHDKWIYFIYSTIHKLFENTV